MTTEELRNAAYEGGAESPFDKIPAELMRKGHAAFEEARREAESALTAGTLAAVHVTRTPPTYTMLLTRSDGATRHVTITDPEGEGEYLNTEGEWTSKR
jgi:hypothetical protein